MDSYQSILDKISVLEKKASSLRETEKKRKVAEIRKLIEKYDIQSAELFSDAKPRLGRPPASAAAPAAAAAASASAKVKQLHQPKPPKFRDPLTGKTWNGHGKTPLWLKDVSDRTAYLINAQAESASNTAKPKGTQKPKPAVGKKPKAAKVTVGKQKRAGKRETAPRTEESDVPSAGS
jgi:DNA-binding protein H-NS